jgi:hypothetical protein
VELYFHSPNTPSWRGAQLNHRDNFTFILIYHIFTSESEKILWDDIYNAEVWDNVCLKAVAMTKEVVDL